MLLAFILGTEIAFWCFLGAGLATRYLLRWRRVSTVLLLCIPLVEVALLVAAVIDLNRGGEANRIHGLAAVFLGVTVAYGSRMMKWADARFAHRYAGGPAPAKRPKRGPEHARAERVGWYRHSLAWMVGCGLLLLGIWWVDDAGRTDALWLTARLWTLILAIDFVVSFSYTLRPRATTAAPETPKG